MKKIFFLILLTYFFSCSEKEDEQPITMSFKTKYFEVYDNYQAAESQISSLDLEDKIFIGKCFTKTEQRTSEMPSLDMSSHFYKYYLGIGKLSDTLNSAFFVSQSDFDFTIDMSAKPKTRENKLFEKIKKSIAKSQVSVQGKVLSVLLSNKETATLNIKKRDYKTFYALLVNEHNSITHSCAFESDPINFSNFKELAQK